MTEAIPDVRADRLIGVLSVMVDISTRPPVPGCRRATGWPRMRHDRLPDGMPDCAGTVIQRFNPALYCTHIRMEAPCRFEPKGHWRDCRFPSWVDPGNTWPRSIGTCGTSSWTSN